MCIRDRIKDGQAHRKFRVDPADRDKARSRALSRETHGTGGNRRPSKPGGRKTPGSVNFPAMGKRRQHSPSASSSRRVDSRVVVVVSQPSSTVTTATVTTQGMAFDADLTRSQGQETDSAPPAKSTRPEEEATAALYDRAAASVDYRGSTSGPSRVSGGHPDTHGQCPGTGE